MFSFYSVVPILLKVSLAGHPTLSPIDANGLQLRYSFLFICFLIANLIVYVLIYQLEVSNMEHPFLIVIYGIDYISYFSLWFLILYLAPKFLMYGVPRHFSLFALFPEYPLCNSLHALTCWTILLRVNQLSVFISEKLLVSLDKVKPEPANLLSISDCTLWTFWYILTVETIIFYHDYLVF